MRIGLVTGHLEGIARAATWGYDYVEIMGALLLPLEGQAAWGARRREIAETGARITNLAGFIGGEARFVGPNVDWERTRAYIETMVERGAEIGVDTFNWGSPMSKSVPEGWPLSRAYEQIERAAHLIADTVAQVAARCVIEPINPGECNVLSYVTDAALLARSTGRSEILCLADFFHMSLQSEPLSHLDRAGALLGHTHTSGPRRLFPMPDQAWTQVAFFRALRRAGYDGRVSVESWTVREGSTYERDAADAAAYLRAVSARVAAEPDPPPEPERDYSWWPP
ncbi:MAG: TIM barrel protein [Chloroflexi bacterium]|nr:TIM barrel protein [Chloroflexota bacterium]